MSLSNEYYKKVLDNLYDGIYLLNKDLRIVYWNSGAEKHTGYESGEILEKACDQVLKHVNEKGIPLCGSTCPVAQTMADGILREVDVYLHHKEGHRIPVSMRIAPIKDSGNEVIVAVEIFDDASPRFQLHQKVEELKHLALLDLLSELGNRRYVEMSIKARLEELIRYGWQFGLLFVDIDHFKHINDTYGHDTGDRVIRMVSRTMSHSLRSFDAVGRWGGEEFIVIVVNVNETGLRNVAERLRLLIEQSSIEVGSDTISVTVSIGATVAQPEDDIMSIIKRSDELMYKSKNSGRNCITMNASSSLTANQSVL